MKFYKVQILIIFIFSICLQNSIAQLKNEKLEQSFEAFNKGEYEEARKSYKILLDEKDYQNGIGYFDTFIVRGEYESAYKEIQKYLNITLDNPFLKNIHAMYFQLVGNYQEAGKIFSEIHDQHPHFFKNKFDCANYFSLIGKKTEAIKLFTEIYQEFNSGNFTDIDLIISSARSAEMIGKFHAANRIYQRINQIDPKNVSILYHWANLYQNKYNNAEAQQMYEEAMEINPNWADLYVGYALAIESFVAKEELAQKALALNPNHIEAMNIQAELHILDSRYEEAENVLKKARKINPKYIQTLANLASVYHLREQKEKYLAIEKLALSINPKSGTFYETLAENCSIRFRYKEAVQFGYKAVEVEPDNWNVQALLGANLLRIGKSDKAKQYLNQSYENDKFNVFTRNSLELIDEYENFDLLESEHYFLKIHKSESVVLGNDILKLAEEAYDTLTNYYPYRPKEKILLEAYHDHSDFGVRISGLPNLDLLGVCFGDIVAFDTPKAQGQDSYNWARTLWHELAHVMTIGISDHRVPRWLTEGLSVFEEKRARPEWARKMEIELFTALDRDQLLPVEKINSGFTRPKFPGQILLSYYQSMRIVDFLVNRYGFSVIPELLKGFGRRETLDSNFRKVLNKSPAEISEAFFDFLKEERKKFEDVLLANENMFDQEKDEVFSLKKIFGKKNSPFFENLFEGIKLANEEKFLEAEKKLIKAIEIYPFYTKTNNPYEVLIRIYRENQNKENLISMLEKFVTVSEYGSSYLLELAEYYRKKGDYKKVEKYYNRYFYEKPYELNAHENLAEIYKQQNLFDEEIYQRKIVIALNPVDKVTAQYNYAFSLYNDNRKTEAKREVLKTLDMAPGFRDAQKLLLLCLR